MSCRRESMCVSFLRWPRAPSSTGSSDADPTRCGRHTLFAPLQIEHPAIRAGAEDVFDREPALVLALARFVRRAVGRRFRLRSVAPVPFDGRTVEFLGVVWSTDELRGQHDARWRHADHGLRLEPKLRAARVLILALRVLVGFLRRCRDEQRRRRETRRTGPCEPPQVLHHHSTLNLAGLHELYWPLWRSTSASAIIFGCFQSLHRPRWPAPLARPAQRKSTSSSFPGTRTTDRPRCPRSTPRPAARSRAPSARGNFRRSPTSCS